MSQNQTVAIQVKTKRSGAWQTTLREWTPRVPDVADTRFWVFVDLHKSEAPSDYFIVPEKWIQNDIEHAHGEYLERHGGQRARTPTSKHHAIRPSRIKEWQDHWDLLGIL